ncbi:MFS transporter [Peribacillus muralis]|uniref:MFS transporter n=1 Tax=Peribacillus muralis TaxID=264697 RepID=A0A1B3XJ50_9BACI|nr:MFS transporter [Peribacillus muralis]AOH53252.1 MFS transporter [Peribacillus muralis]
MNQKLLLFVLILIVGISGFSQGMLLPIIAIIFESDGVGSSLNGFHAASLYIGILLISPFMEAPLRKYGYKPLILFGGITVILSLALFPVWKSFWLWFLLRFFIGVGDHTLHFATQTWITAISPIAKRGRNLAIYGLFFSLGFTVGPLMTKLLEINQSLPFIITSIISLLTWLTVFLIRNELPERDDSANTSLLGTFKRFTKVSRIAWIAFLLPFIFGVLEASLNSNFPVFALRSGIDLTAVSIIIPAFSGGALLTQIPLGMLSDRYGRRRTLLFIVFSGFSIFTLAGIYSHSVIGLFFCFMLGGMMVGSTFSLGISYMADLLPRNLLPAGNLLCSIFYSLGSIGGPFFGGLVIEHIQGGNFFYMISIMLFLVFIALVLFKEKMPAASK